MTPSADNPYLTTLLSLDDCANFPDPSGIKTFEDYAFFFKQFPSLCSDTLRSSALQLFDKTITTVTFAPDLLPYVRFAKLFSSKTFRARFSTLLSCNISAIDDLDLLLECSQYVSLDCWPLIWQRYNELLALRLQSLDQLTSDLFLSIFDERLSYLTPATKSLLRIAYKSFLRHWCDSGEATIHDLHSHYKWIKFYEFSFVTDYYLAQIPEYLAEHPEDSAAPLFILDGPFFSKHANINLPISIQEAICTLIDEITTLEPGLLLRIRLQNTLGASFLDILDVKLLKMLSIPDSLDHLISSLLTLTPYSIPTLTSALLDQLSSFVFRDSSTTLSLLEKAYLSLTDAPRKMFVRKTSSLLQDHLQANHSSLNDFEAACPTELFHSPSFSVIIQGHYLALLKKALPLDAGSEAIASFVELRPPHTHKLIKYLCLQNLYSDILALSALPIPSNL